MRETKSRFFYLPVLYFGRCYYKRVEGKEYCLKFILARPNSSCKVLNLELGVRSTNSHAEQLEFAKRIS